MGWHRITLNLSRRCRCNVGGNEELTIEWRLPQVPADSRRPEAVPGVSRELSLKSEVTRVNISATETPEIFAFLERAVQDKMGSHAAAVR